MPDLNRVTFSFSGKRQGWSESYIFPSNQQTVQQLADLVIFPIAGARRNMLAREYTLDNIRVARIRLDNGDPVKRNVSLYTYDKGPDLVTVANAGDQPRACVLWGADGGDVGGVKLIFMRGIPDDIITNGGNYDGNGASGWSSRASSWRALMLAASYGWLEDKPVGDPFLLTNYIINPNKTVQFSFEGIPFAAIPAGGIASVRLSGINNGSRLNGAHELIVGTDNTATTPKAIAVFDYSFGGKGQLYERPKPFKIAIDTFIKGIRTRDTGRPSFASRGRQPAQARG